MSLPSPEKLLPLIRRGAKHRQQERADVPEYTQIAEFIGEALALSDSQALEKLESRIRNEAPEGLAWYLDILRTFSGTVRDSVSVHHVMFIPLISEKPIEHELVLGSARHELEGQLEHALDLGHGSVKLLKSATPLAVIERTTPLAWRALAEGEPSAAASFEGHPLGACGGALIGVWTVAHEDKARLSRKLMHALNRTPELDAWRLRTQGILQTRSMDSRFMVYPVFQLQDFFTGFRRIRLSLDLERALRELPEAQMLRWEWIDDWVVCSLTDHHGRSKEVRAHFPDEPPELVEAPIQAFCQRRGVLALAK